VYCVVDVWKLPVSLTAFYTTGFLWLIVLIVLPYRHWYLWFCPTFPLALHWNVGSLSAKKVDQVNRITKGVLHSSCKTIAWLPSYHDGHQRAFQNTSIAVTEDAVFRYRTLLLMTRLSVAEHLSSCYGEHMCSLPYGLVLRQFLFPLAKYASMLWPQHWVRTAYYYLSDTYYIICSKRT
jgi:hypothetical protein